MKQKLQEFALVAEIISAAAIVASLIFVGLQVRQGAEETAANSRAIISSVRQSLLDADRELLLFAVDRPYLSEPDSATEEEFQQIWIFMVMMLRTRENYWLQYQDGILDERLYDAYMNSLIRNLGRSEKILLQWKEGVYLDDEIDLQKEFIQEFVQEVDRRLDDYLQAQ